MQGVKTRLFIFTVSEKVALQVLNLLHFYATYRIQVKYLNYKFLNINITRICLYDSVVGGKGINTRKTFLGSFYGILFILNGVITSVRVRVCVSLCRKSAASQSRCTAPWRTSWRTYASTRRASSTTSQRSTSWRETTSSFRKLSSLTTNTPTTPWR